MLAGEIVEKANPSGEHGGAQAGVVTAIGPAYQRRSGGGGGRPGGWWIATEVEVLLESGEVIRPDVLGWRRDRVPERPAGMPVKICPDWISEIVSPSNANTDTVKKLRIYHAARVPHCGSPSRTQIDNDMLSYMLHHMKVLVEIDEDTARKLEAIAPARSRLRSEFIRAALRRALWAREEEATRQAYEEQPDSDEPAPFDPATWENG